MPAGTVKWYNITKGYGFIQPDEGGDEVFVHFSALREAKIKSLTDNQRVTFDAEPNPKRGGKLKAVKVELVR